MKDNGHKLRKYMTLRYKTYYILFFLNHSSVPAELLHLFSHGGSISFHPLTLLPPITTFIVCSISLDMYLGSLYCKQYGPRSDCSLGSSLNRAHSDSFHQNYLV